MIEPFVFPRELSVFDWSMVVLSIACVVLAFCGAALWRDNAEPRAERIRELNARAFNEDEGGDA